MSERRGKKCDYLPEELVAEILSRLPVKSVLRCTTICRSWYSLIKNPKFISSHLQKTIDNKDNNNRYYLCMYSEPNNHFSLRIDNDDFKEYLSLQTPFENFDEFYISGSCNGLVCVSCPGNVRSGMGWRIILWNPMIGKSLLLPSANLVQSHEISVGFGFDPRNNDYNVLRIVKLGYRAESFARVDLYSLNSNSWKDITHNAPKYSGFHHRGTFVNGGLHWVAFQINYLRNQRCNVIMVFDVSDETFRQIPMPACFQTQDAFGGLVYFALTKFRDSSIALIHEDFTAEYESNIWVMNDYCIESSWMKLATVGKNWRGSSTVIGFRHNEEVLIEFFRGWILASQNLNSRRVKNLMKLSHPGHQSIDSYVESLVLLDK